MLANLPKEIWIHIFSFLDFESLQKRSTLVCQNWLAIIRNDCYLSGELRLNYNQKLMSSDINSVLANWKKLKILRISRFRKINLESEKLIIYDNIGEVDLRNVNLKVCKSLDKVIVPHNFLSHEFGKDHYHPMRSKYLPRYIPLLLI